MAREIRPEDDFLVRVALEHLEAWVTPLGDDHKDLAMRLQEIHPRLGLKFHGKDKQFWVCRELDGRPGLWLPLFPCGYFPEAEEVLEKAKMSDLRGRDVRRAAERWREQALARDKRLERDIGERAMPNIGEYDLALRRCDDDWQRRQLAEDIRREVRRVFRRPKTGETVA